MLSAILSNTGTGCLSVSGQGRPRLPSPRARGTCSLHSSHGRTATKLLFSPFLCVSEEQILFFGNFLCPVGQIFLYVCVYMFTCVHMVGVRMYLWSHAAEPLSLYGPSLSPHPAAMGGHRGSFTIVCQVKCPLPSPPVACRAIAGHTFREW